MKHLIRGVTLMAILILPLTGCMTSRQTEKTVDQETLTAASTLRLDTLQTGHTANLTVTNSDRKTLQTTYAIEAMGIAPESATLDVTIQSLRDLPDGATYTARDGRAGVELRRKGDRIEAIGRCDSISRLYQIYRERCSEQFTRIDSLETQLSQLKESYREQASALSSALSQKATGEKPPEGRRWWVLIVMATALIVIGATVKIIRTVTNSK